MRKALVISIVCIVSWSCTEKFEINAPYEEIWAVYGILNAEDSVQYVRISKVFQVEGDALEYAATNDVTVPGLTVTLKGGEVSLKAEEVKGQREPDGDFSPEMTLYAFSTKGPNSLKPGATYQVRIQDAQDSLDIKGQVTLPGVPRITEPNFPMLQGSGCLSNIAFEDSVAIKFQKSRTPIDKDKALGYELRVVFNYRENGQPKRISFGPTRLFSSNKGCGAGSSGNLCYQISKGSVLSTFKSALSDTNNRYSYATFPLCGPADRVARSIQVEITAVDSALYNYIRANDPRFLNLNTYRPEYTNLTGNRRTVGIIGAIAVDQVPVHFTDCGRYFLGLGLKPPGGCAF
ncbi:MAG: DUF4249 family protein [Bacteroidota bacterium]